MKLIITSCKITRGLAHTVRRGHRVHALYMCSRHARTRGEMSDEKADDEKRMIEMISVYVRKCVLKVSRICFQGRNIVDVDSDSIWSGFVRYFKSRASTTCPEQ